MYIFIIDMKVYLYFYLSFKKNYEPYELNTMGFPFPSLEKHDVFHENVLIYNVCENTKLSSQYYDR